MAEKTLTIALAGNPNSGKTTVFNAITGARQHVGNYPGVTVERKEGRCRHGEYDITVVDLPGTYSLTAHSLEELIARNFLVDERPDVVVDIIDSSNLERNLYLATQLEELQVPLVLAFNMSDVAESMGYAFNYDLLSQLLGAPIVPTVGSKREGINELLRVAVRVATEPRPESRPHVRYGRDLEAEIRKLEAVLPQGSELDKYPRRWLAVKLLESDSEVREQIGTSAENASEVIAQAEASRSHLEALFHDVPEVIVAERRYGFISGACEEAVRSTVESRHNISDQIDTVVTNRLLGIPIFLALMWIVFQLTFTVGAAPMSWIEWFFGRLSHVVKTVLPDGYLQSLIADGIVAGVGGVLVFLPTILLLFLAIAFLEDSGYMARAAFIMDRVMHTIGLHGKSFIPMLIGFGCTVPAVMATRILENRRDRITTILVTPLMSCGARLPIYVLLTGAFFPPRAAGNLIWLIYLLGIVMAVVMAKVFRRVLLRGPSTPFVMELPPYRMPTLRGVLIHMWERGWLYLRKAGTIILAISVVMWFLFTFPRHGALEQEFGARIAAADDEAESVALEKELVESRLAASYAGRMGHVIAPVLKPVGLGNWRVSTALVAGLGAKELVVATLGTLYGLGETSEESEALRSALQADPFFSPLVAFTLMVFVLLYIPCLATVVVVQRELNSWRWAGFMVLYTTALAWLASLVVYQGGRLLGLG